MFHPTVQEGLISYGTDLPEPPKKSTTKGSVIVRTSAFQRFRTTKVGYKNTTVFHEIQPGSEEGNPDDRNDDWREESEKQRTTLKKCPNRQRRRGRTAEREKVRASYRPPSAIRQ